MFRPNCLNIEDNCLTVLKPGNGILNLKREHIS